MKIYKKIILTFSLITLVMVSLLGGILFWASNNPEKTWRMVEKYVLPKDMSIIWDELRLESTHLKGLNFHFNLKVTGFHLKKKQPLTDFPIESIQLEFSFLPFEKKQKVIVQRLNLKSVRLLKISLSTNKVEQTENPFQNIKESFEHYILFKNHIDLQFVDIQLKELKLIHANSPFMSMSLVARTDLKEIPNAINLKYKLTTARKQSVMISGKIKKINAGGEGFLLSGVIKGEIPGGRINQKVALKLLNDSSVAGFFNGTGYYKTSKAVIKANSVLKLNMNSKDLDIHLKLLKLKGFSRPLANIHSLTAHFNHSFVAEKYLMENSSNLTINAPIELPKFDVKLKKQLEIECKCILPIEIALQVVGKLWPAKIFENDTEKNKVGEFKANIQSQNNNLFTLKANARLEIDKLQLEYLFIPSIDLELHVFHFLKLTKILAKKNVLIPAPLDIMDGSIRFQAIGPVKSSSISYSLPLRASVNLKSSDQYIDMQVNSNVELNSDFKSAQVDVDVMINKLQLELPPLRPTQGKPRIVIDKRVLQKTKIVKKSNSFNLTVNYQIQTKGSEAIHLLSKYFKPYLPLHINIQHSSEKENSGFIRMSAFDIVYLRRQLHVERMSIDFSDKKIIVDGRLRIKQTLHTIFIDIKGPASKPIILFSSDPYLSRSDIISVLLYNRTTDQLVGSDIVTASYVEAAVADRAIGLFGIWAFAATPIKSFSYNSASQIYTAIIELTDGVSASIDTNWEEEYQVALSKRISRKWTVTAAWMPAGEGQNARTNLVLQWEQRF